MMYPVIDKEKCIKCLTCIRVCSNGAVSEYVNTSCPKCVKYCLTLKVPCSPKLIQFSYDLCDGCGKCIDSCPVNAISFL